MGAYTPKRYRQLQVKDLPTVPKWRLERDSNPRPSGLKALAIPMLHQAQPVLATINLLTHLLVWLPAYQPTCTCTCTCTYQLTQRCISADVSNEATQDSKRWHLRNCGLKCF